MFIFLWLTGLLLSVYISLYVIKKSREIGFTFLCVILTAYVLISNILTPRLTLIDLGFTRLMVVTGSIIWPFTAQISDMINEVYGKKMTILAAVFAYAVNLLFVLFVLMANETSAVWDENMENLWKTYFLPSGRVFLASSISYALCQLIDINVFSYYKEKYREVEDRSKNSRIIGFCSLRSILSDTINMICDAVVFSIIAFAFVLPLDSMLELIVSSIIFKVMLSVIDTPLFALFRIKIKNIYRSK